MIGDYEHYLRPESMERQEARAIAERDHLAAGLDQADSAVTTMVLCAFEARIAAMRELIDVDLSTTDGIATARKLQAEAQRYRDIIGWIQKVLYAGDEATERQDASKVFEEGSPYEPGANHSEAT
jgi:hypothetical protein